MAEPGVPGRGDPAPTALALAGVSFGFGQASVIADLNLQLEPATFFCLLGPSGGGKTTLLKLIGGYLPVRAGHIRLGDRDVTGLPPEQRDIGMVFQNYALFPHLTARENVAFGLEMRRIPRAERRRRVEAMLDRVGLTAAERNRRPAHLSGGQQQRVALARALVIEPKLLLLDEPLANLDRQLREQLRGELKDLQKRTGVTALLVTHDREEALTLADRVGVLAASRLLQADTPEEVYQRPRYPFVARLLGDANFFTVEAIDAEKIYLEGGLSLCRRAKEPVAWRQGGRLLVRPEHCRLMAGTDEKQGDAWPGRVIRLDYLGPDRVVTVSLGRSLTVRVRQRVEQGSAVTSGSAVRVAFPVEALWLLPEDDPAWLVAGTKDATDART
jgi:ABC-type Fe3+/spermidine/putrescine transport system ATPase subunit